MSTTKPLTERLRTDAIFDNTTLGNEAADALESKALLLDVQAGSIEAVQAANQRLAAEVAEHKENAIRNARQAVAFRSERDALQAKLDAMGKGEPVKYEYRDARDDGTWGAWVGCDKPLQPNTWRQVRELYAAPKALAPEPLTDEQKNSAWGDHWSNPSIPSTACSAFYAGMRFAEKHHGIGGTP